MFTTQPITTTSKTQPPAPPHRGDVSMVTPDHVEPTAAIQSSGSNPPVAVSQKGKRKAAKKKEKKNKKVKPSPSDYRRLFRMSAPKQTEALGGFTVDGIVSNLQSKQLVHMSDRALRDLERSIGEAQWDKQAWCTHHECTREEAIAKGPLGGYYCGESGNNYFYFAPKSTDKSTEFTAKQLRMVDEHTACCYMCGQPCPIEPDEDPCECRMGNSHGSFWFQMELGPETIDEERSYGLIKPKWLRTKHQTGLPTGLPTGLQQSEKLYTKDDLKKCFDLNNMSTDQLVATAVYLKNPVGKLENLENGESIVSCYGM